MLPNSRVWDNQKPGLFAAGPAFVLGTTFNEGFNIESNLDEMDHGTIGTFAESFGSDHPGGAFFLFCDASVHFVFDDADPSVLNAMSTRDGNPHSGEERIIHDEENARQGRLAADVDAMTRSRKVVNTPINGRTKGK